MAFTQFTYDMDIISKLSDTPNVDDGLTPDQLKAKFDEGGKAVKSYLNDTLLQEVVEKPKEAGVLKSDAVGNLSKAEPGKDYQIPLVAGKDYQVPAVANTATLAAGSWVANTQTMSVAGVSANNNVIVTPAPESVIVWGECQVVAVSQAAGSLTFRCEDVPEADITVNILIVE